MQNSIQAHEGGGMSFTGPKAVAVYRATVIASGLRFYIKTGMRLNRAYTPKAMMEVAAEITGKKFKARDYAGAEAALTEWARAQASVINVVAAAGDTV